MKHLFTARPLLLLAGALSLLSAAVPAVTQAQGAAPPARPDFSPGEYFVGFRPGAQAQGMAAARQLGATVTATFPGIRAAAVRGGDPTALAIARSPHVAYVERVPTRYALGLDDEQLVPALNNGLYGLITTRATDTHADGVTGAGINVGVADTGLDYYHPDIAPNYRGGTDTIAGDDDPLWESFWDPEWGEEVAETHGTHVAGTVIAANNSVGVLGVAPSANLYHARVLDAYGGTAATVMDGVRWLVETAGCKVVNLSLGGAAPSTTEQNFYGEMRSKGALIVCAAGNGSGTTLIYPAGYASNIAVGAVDVNNSHASFSNTGSALDVSAPGVRVLSSVPQNHGFQESWVRTTETFASNGFEYAGLTDGITRPIIECGLGKIGEFPPTVLGNIALIKRGDITFSDKVTNAMNAGALAVIIYNNVAGDLIGTLGTSGNWIPAVSVSDTAGAILVSQAGSTGTVVNRFTSWDTYDGTSMAAPHVTGVLALAWSVNPTASNSAVENSLFTTCTDLGAVGYDTTFGFGLVDAYAAVAKVGSPASPPLAPTNLTATAGDQRVTLAWNASAGADYYDVQRATSGSPYQFAGRSTGTNFTDLGLTNDVTYYYVVVAVNSGGASASSNAVSATPTAPPPPAAPTSLTAATGKGKRRIELKWAQSSSSGVTQNRIYRSTASGGAYALRATISAGPSFSDTSVVSGVTYYYVVTAVSSSGRESVKSNEASARSR